MVLVCLPRQFVISYVPAHRRETTTKFCTAIKLDVRKILQGRPRMLTSDLFAVANLLVLMITLAVSVMCVKNVAKMTSMLLMLVVLGAFIPASQAFKALTCYACLYCADPYEPSSSAQTCQGEVCAKAKYKGEGRFKIHFLKFLLHLMQLAIFLTYTRGSADADKPARRV